MEANITENPLLAALFVLWHKPLMSPSSIENCKQNVHSLQSHCVVFVFCLLCFTLLVYWSYCCFLYKCFVCLIKGGTGELEEPFLIITVLASDQQQMLLHLWLFLSSIHLARISYRIFRNKTFQCAFFACLTEMSF